MQLSHRNCVNSSKLHGPLIAIPLGPRSTWLTSHLGTDWWSLDIHQCSWCLQNNLLLPTSTGDSQISTNSTIQCTDLSWSTHRVQYSLLDLAWLDSVNFEPTRFGALDLSSISSTHCSVALRVKVLLQRCKELQDVIAILGLEELSDAQS